MKRTILMIALAGLGSLNGVRPSQADEGFFGRLNPLGFFRAAPVETSSETRMENLRTQLAERGLDEAAIDQRILQISEARANGTHTGLPFDGRQPNLDDIRARLEQRGIDSAAIDDRIARITAPPESGTIGNRPHGIGNGTPPSIENLRTRLEQQGISSEDINSRLARIETSREQMQTRIADDAAVSAGVSTPDFPERAARFRNMHDRRHR